MWWRFRLKEEYKVDCVYEPVSINTVRWIDCADERKLAEFKKKAMTNYRLMVVVI
jgi:peptide chain release factor 3